MDQSLNLSINRSIKQSIDNINHAFTHSINQSIIYYYLHYFPYFLAFAVLLDQQFWHKQQIKVGFPCLAVNCLKQAMNASLVRSETNSMVYGTPFVSKLPIKKSNRKALIILEIIWIIVYYRSIDWVNSVYGLIDSLIDQLSDRSRHVIWSIEW